MSAWQTTEADLAMLQREIVSFLPDRIFDAHAHLVAGAHFAPGAAPAYLQGNADPLDLAAYRHYAEWIHPAWRTVGGLFFGMAFTGDRAANNRLVAAECAAGRAQGFQALAQLVVAPDLPAEQLAAQLQAASYAGLKCYHTMARVAGPTWQAPIEDYLPEDHVRVAHENGLSITLHIVRERALADPLNQATIRRYCTAYPNMRLILAHAGRGFNPWHTIEGIAALRGLENLWFDTSAVTEAGACEAIIQTFGHQRLLYGSDFPISHLRGRCVAIGDSFHWFYADEMTLAERHTTLQPALIGLEALRSLGLAIRRLKLSDRQVEDLFYGNAAQLYGLDGL